MKSLTLNICNGIACIDAESCKSTCLTNVSRDEITGDVIKRYAKIDKCEMDKQGVSVMVDM